MCTHASGRAHAPARSFRRPLTLWVVLQDGHSLLASSEHAAVAKALPNSSPCQLLTSHGGSCGIADARRESSVVGHIHPHRASRTIHVWQSAHRENGIVGVGVACRLRHAAGKDIEGASRRMAVPPSPVLPRFLALPLASLTSWRWRAAALRDCPRLACPAIGGSMHQSGGGGSGASRKEGLLGGDRR